MNVPKITRTKFEVKVLKELKNKKNATMADYYYVCKNIFKAYGLQATQAEIKKEISLYYHK